MPYGGSRSVSFRDMQASPRPRCWRERGPAYKLIGLTGPRPPTEKKVLNMSITHTAAAVSSTTAARPRTCRICRAVSGLPGRVVPPGWVFLDIAADSRRNNRQLGPYCSALCAGIGLIRHGERVGIAARPQQDTR